MPAGPWRGRCRRVAHGTYGQRVVLVCGQGNNGGDGLVAARVLAGWGMRTRVFELAAGIDQVAFTRALADAHVVVDAMYGTGFRGALDGNAAFVAEQLVAWNGPTVAVDIPSGVDGLRGLAFGPAVRADAHGDVRRPQARSGVRARSFVRRGGRGRRHRDRPRARAAPRIGDRRRRARLAPAPGA